MNMMKKIIAIAVMSASACAFADLKVGVVSIQEVFQQVPQGQAAVNQMKQDLAPAVKKLSNEQDTLQTAVANFERNAPTLSAKDKATQEQAINTQQQQLQEDVTAFRKTEAAAQQEAATNFQNALVSAINQVAQQGNYDMVMTDQTIPFYKDNFDVTSQVVSLMQKSTKS